MAQHEGHVPDTQNTRLSPETQGDNYEIFHRQLSSNAEYAAANKILRTIHTPGNMIAYTLTEFATLLTNQIEVKRLDKNTTNIVKAISAVLRLYEREYANILITKVMEEKLDRLTQLAQNKLDANINKLERNIKHIEATAVKYSELTVSSQDHAKTINNAIKDLSGITSQAHTNTQRTYSETLRQTAGPPASKATANNAKIFNRLNIQATQVLVEFDPTTEAMKQIRNQSTETTNQLRTKAIAALAKATEGSEMKASIKNTVITRRGALLMELNSSNAATWLRKENNAKKFTDAFIPGSKLRKKTFPVIIKFVPIRWTPETPETLRELEADLSLPKGSILEAKWIKDPTRRGRNQEKAHVKAHCADPDTANKILISDVHICHTKVAVTRDTWEPSVCGKCQEYGHFAKECNKTADRCGRCAGEHRTFLCTNDKDILCTPCGSKEHETNSPSCKHYASRLDAQKIKCPETLMAFYPTDQPWTWDTGETVPWIKRPMLSFDLGQALLSKNSNQLRANTKALNRQADAQTRPNPKQKTLWNNHTGANALPLGTSTAPAPGWGTQPSERARSNSVSSTATARPNTTGNTSAILTPTATTPMTFSDIVLPTGELTLTPEPEAPMINTPTANAATPMHETTPRI